MAKYDLVALGGTFDLIHKGHIALLERSFTISSKAIIGLTSDELALQKGKKLINNYSTRSSILSLVIKKNFPKATYEISKLENDFGPAVLEGKVQALVVSKETSYQGDVLNKLRLQKNLPKVDIVVVPMVLAKDGNRISTTRIRKSEIDEEGNLVVIDK